MTLRLLDNAALPTSYGEPKVVYRNVAAETAALIDILLPEDEQNTIEALYDSEELAQYFDENGLEKLDFGGGEFGITANMLLEVPISVLRSVKFRNGRSIGKHRAEMIHDACEASMATEPYY